MVETSGLLSEASVPGADVMAPPPAPAKPGFRRKEAFVVGEMMAAQVSDVERETAELLQIDPHAMVQTGRGLPQWNWSQSALSWNGATSKNQHLRLYLLSPFMNMVAGMLRIILLIWFVLALFKGWRRTFSAAAIFLMGIFITGFPSGAGAEDFPPPSLLEDLQHRIQNKQCRQFCASINRARLVVTDDTAEIEMSVSSRGAGSVALPGPADQLSIERVLLDGLETKALRREEGGIIRVRIPDGVHSIKASALIAGSDTVNLSFDDKPQFVELSAPGWNVDGLSPGGAVEGTLQLMRLQKKSDAASSQALPEGTLPSWIRVRREFQLAIPWKIRTTAERLGSTDRPSVERIPVFPGESVLDERIKIENGSAIVNFGRGVRLISWEGSFREISTFTVSAPASAFEQHITETWVVRCAPMWRCETSGPPPQTSVVGGQAAQIYAPYPGEEMRVVVQKPEGVQGSTMTIGSVSYNITPNDRMQVGVVEMQVKSSQTGHLNVDLPEGAAIQKLSLNGAPLDAAIQGKSLSIPISPGNHSTSIEFSLQRGLSIFWRFPPVSLNLPGANMRLNASMPERRWLLFCGGPAWGPVVLVWTKLLFLLTLALLLGKRVDPPGTRGWFILGLGLVTLPVVHTAAVAAWFIALHYRKSHQSAGRRTFNLTQTGIVVLTFLMLAVLYMAVQKGLIFSPDMAIFGPGPGYESLSWYSDFTQPALPAPWIVSLPLWVWRIVMLAWAAWLVTALIKWLRWGYGAFTSGGVWKNEAASEK